MSTAVACPSNLHVSVWHPASDIPPLRERVEQKFFVVPRREPLAFALLRRTCRDDPVYPVGRVNSLYFDTPDLDQHQRSDSGEYAKDKVRIRWYGEDYDPHRQAGSYRAAGAPAWAIPNADRDVQVWLELKSRRGFASTKQRVVLPVSPAALRFPVLRDGVVPATTLAHTMAGFGFFPRGPLRPVIVISYWRHRFVEPRSGFRISIDSHIRSSMMMPGVGQGERGLELPGAIVEVKGPVFEVPPSLREIADIGSSWTRYSKYSSSLDGHAATRGSVSRLWPSGMLDGRSGVLGRVGLPVQATEPGSVLNAPRFVEDCEN